MIQNPDPKRYVIRLRRGKAILVDRQILRWRKQRRKEAKAKEPAEKPTPKVTDPTRIKFFE